MPVGLRVWNAAGQLTLDTNSKVGRVIGMAFITGDGGLHYFDVPRNAGEKVFAHLQMNSPQSGSQASECRVGDDFTSGSDSNRVWYALASGQTGFIVYGVY